MEAQRTNKAEMPGSLKDRRRYPRYFASWPASLLVDSICLLLGGTVDVSAHGMRLRLTDVGLSMLIKPGEQVRAQVRFGRTEDRITRVGEVRHVSNGEVGMEIKEELPARMIPPGSARPF